jgi:hypothetical protein
VDEESRFREDLFAEGGGDGGCGLVFLFPFCPLRTPRSDAAFPI